jgi:hypothetical protein
MPCIKEIVSLPIIIIIITTIIIITIIIIMSFVKSTPFSSPLFHHKHPTEKYYFINKKDNYYLCLCAQLSLVSIKRSSQNQFSVIYLKT